MAELSCEVYAKRREELYGALRREGVFSWDSMYGEEYALASVVPISEAFRTELKQASEALGGVFARTVAVVMQAGDELLAELGLPEAAWGAVRTSLPELLPTVIGRFDFAATPEGLKMLEFNAETPTDIVEAFYVNGKVCDFFGVRDPNAGMAVELRHAFTHAVRTYRAQGFSTERIVFSSVDWPRCRASGLASPTLLAPTSPWRRIAPLAKSMASKRVVLPAPGAPTRAMARVEPEPGLPMVRPPKSRRPPWGRAQKPRHPYASTRTGPDASQGDASRGHRRRTTPHCASLFGASQERA